LRRHEIRNGVALAALAVLLALLALRFDLLWSLVADLPAGATLQHASVPQRAAAAATERPARSDPRPVEDRAVPTSTFDVVRIASDGPAVVAGRAPADARVTILANAEPIATVKADGNGEWVVVIDREFKPGDYQLSLRAKPSGVGQELIGQSVRITIAPSARAPLANARASSSPTKAAAAPMREALLPPAPITFVYDKTDFTPAGREGAAVLSGFLRQQKLDSVTLSGHADERGSDEYNMELSRRRLDSVARYLREAGYAGKLVLVPKGKSEPFLSPDRWKLSREDALQLDRRVELHLAR
jgi:outer membrane protein OmpA-like peptidoglycan-associated protein